METVQISTLMPNFDENGLVPVVVQDKNTNQVLMFQHVNLGAYEATLKTGYAHFFSRSRKRVWKKGEMSDNPMRVEDIKISCDGYALIYLVMPSGPACHTGKETCFWRSVIGYFLETKWGRLRTMILVVWKAIAKV